MSTGSQAKIIGRPLNRVDGPLKVKGEARYAAEFPVAKLVHAVTIQSTIAKGTIKQVDTKAAEQIPGVLAIITHLNMPKVDGTKGEQNKLLVLQDNVIQHSGQHIGVVVADTFEQAMLAASLVKIAYSEEKPTLGLKENMERGTVPQGKIPGNESPDSTRGNFSQAFSAAETQIEQTYTTPMENHNPMEPHATTAVWNGDSLLLYDATQGIFGVKKKVAAVLGISPEKVRTMSYYVGGGFGCKGSVWSHVVLAAVAARQVNRPVKLVLGRIQMFGPVGCRPATIQKVQIGAGRDGKLTALRHSGSTQTAEFDEFLEPVAKTSRMIYQCENVETAHRLVALNIGKPTFMRAPGEASGSFALESAMDELAYALKLDPVELRLRNYAESDLHKGLPWSSNALKECYRVGAQKFGWEKRNPVPGSMKADGKLVGWGMATATYPTNRSPASAQAQIMADGTALVKSGSQDIGTGTYTVMTQVAAEALGLPVEKVHFELGDTQMPETPVSGGSQTAASVGSAVHEASLQARNQLVQIAIADRASPLYGVSAQDVVAENGSLAVKGKPGQAETYRAILARQGLKQIEAKVDAKAGAEKGQYSMHSFGAQFAEVQVDPHSGEVRVTRWVGAYGVGRILNAKTARSQLIGGIVYGIGMALMEETVMDPNTGRIVNADLAEYHVPVNADVPEIEVIFVDETDTHINPIGVKGIGEIGITGAAAAIANAVYHATGKRIRDLPITLDKLL